jgi:hypothetical protein
MTTPTVNEHWPKAVEEGLIPTDDALTARKPGA